MLTFDDIQEKTILFLCSGNIIRSAFAEIYAKHLGLKNVHSAGTVYFNNAITQEAARRLIEEGVDMDLLNQFQPTHISELQLINPREYIIFGMKQEHLDSTYIQNFPYKFLLSEINDEKYEIKDPYFEGGYNEVFDMIKNLLEKLVYNILGSDFRFNK
ncbi:MAG: hypothetical protein INQ03_20540 [Candidatus Heimdallarchaeota archaeon]|nr:hypothetical protein [Candidatus Heimdallarchaeota archaeon]